MILYVSLQLSAAHKCSRELRFHQIDWNEPLRVEIFTKEMIVFPGLSSIGQALIVLHHQLMMAIPHAFIQRKEYTQRYYAAPTALTNLHIRFRCQ